MPKIAPLSICGITQELKPEYYSGWTEEELAALNMGAKEITMVLTDKLNQAGFAVQEIYCVIHNRDTEPVWNESKGKYDNVPKATHFHAAIKFLRDDEGRVLSGTPTQIARAVGLEPQYIEKAGKGRYVWDNMLSYLIHIKHRDKAQYAPDEVFSYGAERDGKRLYSDYMDIYADRKKVWDEGRIKVTVRTAQMDADILEEDILMGRVTRKQVLLEDNLYSVYARSKRRMDDAFNTYAERKIERAIQSMEDGAFKMTVFFVTGRSHSGKSVFTDNLVKRIQRDMKASFGQEWSVCSCAASNPFDEYEGEEILVMDDLRGVALTTSDWLKLLDPDRVGTGSARYRNRKIASRVIIINAERDVADFFLQVKGRNDDDEAMDQFYRRITARIEVYREPETDTRRVIVGEMQESDAYDVVVTRKKTTLTLHHDFNKDSQDMAYSDALNRLSDMVLLRNTYPKYRLSPEEAAELAEMPEMDEEEMEAIWDEVDDALAEYDLQRDLENEAEQARYS